MLKRGYRLRTLLLALILAVGMLVGIVQTSLAAPPTLVVWCAGSGGIRPIAFIPLDGDPTLAVEVSTFIRQCLDAGGRPFVRTLPSDL